MGTFWDFCAPFYDIAEKAGGGVYEKMLETVRGIVPRGATVLEAAAGTGSISLAVSDKAKSVICTDVSKKMLNVAQCKIIRRGANNITIAIQSIYELAYPDNSFDVAIASQILHLIDEPEKAAAELRRVAKTMVILPMSFTKKIKGMAKLGVDIYRIFGFAPKIEFTPEEYTAFLPSIGFENCEYIQISGNISMAVAVWKNKAFTL
jgi:ubiquinone/menaquinone biosynthesis C-methylase UbiE